MEEREEIRRKREKGREADDSRTGRRKDGIRCRGKDIRKGRIASGRIETGAEIQGGAQNKEKPASDAGEKKKENRGIPRGTGQRNSAGLKTREQNEESRH